MFVEFVGVIVEVVVIKEEVKFLVKWMLLKCIIVFVVFKMVDVDY